MGIFGIDVNLVFQASEACQQFPSALHDSPRIKLCGLYYQSLLKGSVGTNRHEGTLYNRSFRAKTFIAA